FGTGSRDCSFHPTAIRAERISCCSAPIWDQTIALRRTILQASCRAISAPGLERAVTRGSIANLQENRRRSELTRDNVPSHVLFRRLQHCDCNGRCQFLPYSFSRLITNRSGT